MLIQRKFIQKREDKTIRKPFVFIVFTFTLLIAAYFLVPQVMEESQDHSAGTESTEDTEAAEQIFDNQTFMSASVLRDRIDELPDSTAKEIISGGPPPDGIPSIDQPKFIALEEADQWLAANEPVNWEEVGKQQGPIHCKS